MYPAGMPLPDAMKKALLDELSKMGDKAVSKRLNEILFREPLQEGVGLPGNTGTPPVQTGVVGSGQSTNIVGGSQAADQSTGPGGV